MGFEYVYAYLENLQWMFIGGTVLCVVALFILFIARATNEIDADDWRLMMFVVVPALAVFIFLDCSPGMEHIQQVRTTAIKPFQEEKSITQLIREDSDEKSKPVFYPSASCTNSLMCSGR